MDEFKKGLFLLSLEVFERILAFNKKKYFFRCNLLWTQATIPLNQSIINMTSKEHDNFLALYESCQGPFLKYCAALTNNKMDQEDLVQDVLLSAYVHFGRIKEKDSFLHYLIRSARNKTISQWRKSKRQVALLEKYENRFFTSASDIEKKVEVQLMYQALKRLPKKQREALFLFEFCGFSLKEIALFHAVSLSSVKTNVCRGRAKLKGLLSSEPKKRGRYLGILLTANGIYGILEKVELGLKQLFIHKGWLRLPQLKLTGMLPLLTTILVTLASTSSIGTSDRVHIGSEDDLVSLKYLVSQWSPTVTGTGTDTLLSKRHEPKIAIMPGLSLSTAPTKPQEISQSPKTPIFLDENGVNDDNSSSNLMVNRKITKRQNFKKKSNPSWSKISPVDTMAPLKKGLFGQIWETYQAPFYISKTLAESLKKSIKRLAFVHKWVTNRKDDFSLSILSDNHVYLNKEVLLDPMQAKQVLSLIKSFGIDPGPNRRIMIKDGILLLGDFNQDGEFVRGIILGQGEMRLPFNRTQKIVENQSSVSPNGIPNERLEIPPTSEIPEKVESPEFEHMRFNGDLDDFKSKLVQYLLKDKLIRRKKASAYISFLEGEVVVQGRVISEELQNKYLDFFQANNILPYEGNSIELGWDYIFLRGAPIDK